MGSGLVNGSSLEEILPLFKTLGVWRSGNLPHERAGEPELSTFGDSWSV